MNNNQIKNVIIGFLGFITGIFLYKFTKGSEIVLIIFIIAFISLFFGFNLYKDKYKNN